MTCVYGDSLSFPLFSLFSLLLLYLLFSLIRDSFSAFPSSRLYSHIFLSDSCTFYRRSGSARPNPDGISGYTVCGGLSLCSCRDLPRQRSSREAKGKGQGKAIARRWRIRERQSFWQRQRQRRYSIASIPPESGRYFPRRDEEEKGVDCPLRLIYFDISLTIRNQSYAMRARLSDTNSRERIIRNPQIFTKWNGACTYMMLQDAAIVIAKLQDKGIQMTMFYG